MTSSYPTGNLDAISQTTNAAFEIVRVLRLLNQPEFLPAVYHTNCRPVGIPIRRCWQRSTELVLWEANLLCIVSWCTLVKIHDEVIKWKHFPSYWPLERGIHRSSVDSPHNDQWHGALIFSLSLDKWLSKRSRRPWFETLWRSFWRRFNAWPMCLWLWLWRPELTRNLRLLIYSLLSVKRHAA